MSPRLLVTGASSGIGAACANAALEAGYHVVAAGRTAPQAQALEWNRVDLEDVAETDRWLANALARGDRLDGAILAAGWEEVETPAVFDAAVWQRTLRLNVEAPAQLCLGLAPVLSEGAAIVMIGSTVAAAGSGISSSYAASKAALEALAWSLRLVLPDLRLRVNVIRAGPTRTPMFDRLATAAGTDSGAVNSPEQIAQLALFLVGPQSAAVAATTVAADQGRLAPGSR